MNFKNPKLFIFIFCLLNLSINLFSLDTTSVVSSSNYLQNVKIDTELEVKMNLDILLDSFISVFINHNYQKIEEIISPELFVTYPDLIKILKCNIKDKNIKLVIKKKSVKKVANDNIDYNISFDYVLLVGNKLKVEKIIGNETLKIINTNKRLIIRDSNLFKLFYNLKI